MLIKRETMGWTWPGWDASNSQALDLYNYVHQYDNRFTLDGNNTSVDFDGKFKIKILSDYSTYRPHWGIQCSDSNQTVYDTQPSAANGRSYWFECKPSLNVFFMDSEDFVYLIAWPRDAAKSTTCIGFIYIKTQDGNCYAQTLNPGTPHIDGRPYYNVITGSSVQFNLNTFINVSVPVGEIFTTDKCYIFGANFGEYHDISLFKSTSIVTYDQVINISGKNYYTAGTHTIVSLD